LFDPDELADRRSDLATALRRLRRESGLSGARLAARVAMSQSKISKIENGRLTPTVFDVDRILKALNVPQDIIEHLLGLARLANTHFHDVRSSQRRGLHYRQQELAALEAAASTTRYFLPVMITGLLHLPEYAARSFGTTAGDQTQAIARRLDRQKVLRDDTKSFIFLLTEAAVRWPLCPPSVMASQVDRLISVSQFPTVTMGIIPFTTEVPDSPLNTFTVYDDRIVTAETVGGLVVMRDPRDVVLHLEAFAFFHRYALLDDDARVA
jgi:transcriptional regulator with XRE-family HTH domain